MSESSGQHVRTIDASRFVNGQFFPTVRKKREFAASSYSDALMHDVILFLKIKYAYKPPFVALSLYHNAIK